MSDRVKAFLSGLSVPGKPDEFEVKNLLSSFGICVPAGVRLNPQDELDISGLSAPFALKVCSGDILHKTNENGVALNLGEDSLSAAVIDFRERFPGRSLLVEEQLSFDGVEFIVGGLNDPDFGPAVMAGTGGILTELYQDVSFRLAPLTATEALFMLDEIRIADVLKGFRGMKSDPHGLAQVISRVGDMVCELGENFNQLDINPLVYGSGKWTALDAALMLVTGQESTI